MKILGALSIGIVFVILFSGLTPLVLSYNHKIILPRIQEDIKFKSYRFENPLCPIKIKNISYEYEFADDDMRLSDFIESNSYQLSGPADSDWPMKCHDNRHTSLSPYYTDHVSGIEKWRFKVNSSIDGGITIGKDGIIYFGSWDYHLYAIYPDGNQKWKSKCGNIIWAAPAIADDGTIYIGSYHAKLYAIYSNGIQKWNLGLGGSISSSPAIADDGTIYVGTMGDTGRMCAVNPDGTIKWRFDTGYHITSDPAIGNNDVIYFGSGDNYVYAINPNGTLKWKYETGHYVKGPPSIADDGTIYIGSWDDYLYAFYPNNGTIKWKLKIDNGFETNPSLGSDGTIYIAARYVYAVRPDGTIIWKFEFQEENENVFQSSPAVSADGIIYVGTGINGNYGGQIYAINSDGSLRWNKYLSDLWIDSSPSIGEDGTVYIGSTNNCGGYLHAFNEVISNEKPLDPEFIGSTVKKAFSFEYYRFRGYDPENNPIQFFIDWGNGRTSGWSKECACGEIYEVYEMIFGVGRRTIRFKTRDVMGEESDWVNVELMYPYQYNPGWRFPLLSRLIEIIGLG